MILALLLATEVPVLARSVERGEVLTATDFVLEQRSGPVPPILPPNEVIGREATRRLAAGSLLRPSDVASPRLVKRGEPVTLLVQSDGLSITATGRALADGRHGDVVRVVNGSTNRTLEGIVERAGVVRLAMP